MNSTGKCSRTERVATAPPFRVCDTLPRPKGRLQQSEGLQLSFLKPNTLQRPSSPGGFEKCQMEESGFVIRRRRENSQDIVVSMEMWLVNNELQEPGWSPRSCLTLRGLDTPSTGTLSFDCVGDAHLAQVMNY